MQNLDHFVLNEGHEEESGSAKDMAALGSRINEISPGSISI